MKRLLTAFILLLTCGIVMAQSDINGKIVDKSDSKPLTNASIVLLNQDSIMKFFTRADEDGNFSFKKIKNEPYIMLISYPKFEVISRKINPSENRQLGTIPISSQANLIEEVVITHKLPIQIKGDTIEYNAGSFETEKNAKLEDLLRRLPGLSVSADGAITAHGKSVSKVLIDGEEFFGYDPKIAIRNVRADAVDKVQVYERKSEQAEMTGVDDGQRFQTVNVILKEEARKGIFGNAEANIGTEELYTANLFAAKFNRTERIGITVNTNNMGANSGGREGSLRMNSQITGEPLNTAIGANYENQFFNKKVNVNSNYNFSTASNRNKSENYNKEIIPGSDIQETNSSTQNENTNQSNNFRSQFRWRVDSTSNIEFQLNGNLSKTTSANITDSKMVDQNQDSIRNFSNNTNNTGNNASNDFRINYRKRLNKKGTSLNAFISNDFNESDQKSLVNQKTYFYRNDSLANVNQNRFTDSYRNNFNAQLQVSDKINDRLSYSLGYNFSKNVNKSTLDAYDTKDGNLTFNNDYSKNQKTNNYNQGLVTNLNYFTEKISLSVNNRTNYRDQSIIDRYRDIDLDRTFWDNDLNINGNYRISNRKNINISYQNNYDIPTFDQLQPLQPQTNNIFIQEGNPDLKRSSNNSFRANYSTMSLLKGTSWNINSSIAFKNDPIVNKRTIDKLSRTRSTYINVTGKSSWNANINANYSKPVFNKSAQMNLSSGANYNNGFSFIQINNADDRNKPYELSNAETASLFLNFGINEQNSKGLDYDINWRVSANNQRNSLQSSLNYTNLSTGGNGYLCFFLPKKFNLTTNIVYNLDGPTKLYKESIHQFYSNIEVSKKLLKSESLVASVKVYDVFGTFNNINRNVSDNNFSETSQMILTQYVLFGLKWDFNKNLGKKSE